eukprot:gnl/TRDRNA2_/TRDRNA2_208872_c0_seq1.p1 gnl/TRDRNA2_/TRDRNA2_208872_c0~~gnl/TRDRNA2_/TRDRNA2_208872_c0_seq1.p1  ORF type:complete len:126 (-),score=0.12 gnl/TRDRNA2_/TRDRNA2_208872_c0_seq1:423-800(-)
MRSSATLSRVPCDPPACAKTQAVLASSLALNLPICHADPVASTANSFLPDWRTFIKAHAAFARLCGPKSPACRTASCAQPANSVRSQCSAAASAQVVLAKTCSLNRSLICCSTSRASTTDSLLCK